ncbi:hypothetical protein Dda_0675 [Drechslerella dactyloides]|uniref:Uncharacterized protein n=1 Tax=Drechslerella dactyloides TaxID=74499 RepID=A0AAD6J4W5_DREDA|nr:hypothetical protein Dda_0675 [Drechslerella dactyloides]
MESRSWKKPPAAYEVPTERTAFLTLRRSSLISSHSLPPRITIITIIIITSNRHGLSNNGLLGLIRKRQLADCSYAALPACPFPRKTLDPTESRLDLIRPAGAS